MYFDKIKDILPKFLFYYSSCYFYRNLSIMKRVLKVSLHQKHNKAFPIAVDKRTLLVMTSFFL